MSVHIGHLKREINIVPGIWGDNPYHKEFVSKCDIKTNKYIKSYIKPKSIKGPLSHLLH